MPQNGMFHNGLIKHGLTLTLRPYRLPLIHPWRSARGELRERIGWLVIASAGGFDGFGDCAPLPAAGTETLAAAERRLGHWQDSGQAAMGNNAMTSLLDALSRAAPSVTPCADCAVETALLDLQARQQGLPLRRLLTADAGAEIAVNAALGSAATLTADRVASACAEGYRVLKLKVGTADPETELTRLRAATAALPSGVLLRLDANGAWDRERAARVIADLAGLPVDCIEEPLRNPDDAALGLLQQGTDFALALDESLPRRPRPIDPFTLPVRRLVLKPGVIGGLRPTLHLAGLARAAGREIVLTSLIESAAGLWATTQLAAAIGSPLAHGLATGDWLADDLGPAPRPRQGRIALPETPGSGFEPTRSFP